jgi:hypothetical protein
MLRTQKEHKNHSNPHLRIMVVVVVTCEVGAADTVAAIEVT